RHFLRQTALMQTQVWTYGDYRTTGVVTAKEELEKKKTWGIERIGPMPDTARRPDKRLRRIRYDQRSRYQPFQAGWLQPRISKDGIISPVVLFC
ncbi:hypothetical protein CRT22_16240, partial [Escherichia sp. E5028]|uniref:hypothetical protein n=1 Tax=Escherichia sp. E5028 TaxID=2044602 RepID=UPI00107EF0F9